MKRRTKAPAAFTGRRQAGPHGKTLDMLAAKAPEPVYVKQFLTAQTEVKGKPVGPFYKVGDWTPHTDPDRDVDKRGRARRGLRTRHAVGERSSRARPSPASPDQRGPSGLRAAPVARTPPPVPRGRAEHAGSDSMNTEEKPAAPAVEHEHIFEERWYPLDKQHVRRVCVLPGCTVRQVRVVRS